MRAILLDGPSKVGKTCVGTDLSAHLESQIDGPIRFDVIGDFFRRMTVAVMEELGPDPAPDALLKVLAKVIDSNVAFDNGRTWGDLHSPEVDNLVSTVGEKNIAQKEKYTWGGRALAKALDEETELWIVDGRNPRRTLADAWKLPEVSLVLDLFIHCDLEPSALRAGVPLAQLERRRAQDMSGDDPLLVYPPAAVPYEPVSTAGWPSWFVDNYEGEIERSVIETSWHGNAKPNAVFLDTSQLGINDDDLGLGRMLSATHNLAHAALQWYNQR